MLFLINFSYIENVSVTFIAFQEPVLLVKYFVENKTGYCVKNYFYDEIQDEQDSVSPFGCRQGIVWQLSDITTYANHPTENWLIEN